MALSLVTPEEVTDLVAFRPSLVDTAVPEQLDYSVTGCVSQCGTEATVCSGSCLRNYQAHTGRLCSELRLGSQERPLVGPFVNFVHAGKALVAVAVQGGSGGPLLCVCHPSSGRVIRAIHLTAPATHLALVSGDSLGKLAGGWLALAMEDRRLLLLGLCLDSGLHYSDEGRPAGVVALDGLFSSEISDLSPAYHGGPVHPCVHVCDLDSLVEIEEQMPSGDEDLEVTCLEWLPQLGCLGIGLACGNVHIWDLETLSSVLAMSCASDLPVVALAVQEPENDPRCFCYLWVAQGATTAPSAFTLSCFSTTTMHSMSFRRKEPRQDGRYVYRDFQHARPMFEYPLVPEVVASKESLLQPALDSGELGSRIISLRTVPPPLCPLRGGGTGGGSSPPPHAVRTEHTEDLGVLLLSWQLLRGGRVVGSYLSLFDINQWYRAHMPHSFRLNALQVSSYVGLFSLEEAVAKCGGRTLLDVRVPPSSVKKFLSPDTLVEQTHFPSSLAFSCVCLTAEGTVHGSFLGMQRQLLHNMNVQGPKCLNEANDLCARLSVAGLVGDSVRSQVFRQGPAVAQGRLLNVALEHRMVGFLVACLRGCTRPAGDSTGELLLPFVLKWTWAKVKEAKNSLDKLYVPLFDCSGQDVTEVGQRMSTHLEELSILHRLLEHACAMDPDDPGLVETQCDVVGLLTGHLRVLLFLLHSNVLPDHRMSPGFISYPCAILRTWCLQARKDLGGKLLVDVLIEAASAGTEEVVATPFMGNDYPPSSIQLAMEVYLCRGLAPWAPHALTYYLLLDISSVIVHDHPAVQENLERFPAAFSLGADLQALIQGIWRLDHGIHEEGLEHLQRAHSLATSGLRAMLGVLWGPAVRLLLRRGAASLALCGLGRLQAASTPEELALQLDVLLANGRVIDALELVRKHSQLSSLDQLLGSIVALASRKGVQDARKQLDFLLQVPLSAAEEEQLTGFFCELADPAWLCQVALHFLQCRRPHTAIPLTATIREIFREGRAQQPQRPYPEEVRKQAAATLELMQSFMRLIPLPASQQRGAAVRKRNTSTGLPVHFLGTVPTRVPHRGTTPKLVSKVSAVRATMDATEDCSSRPMPRSQPSPIQVPRATNRQTPAEQQGSAKSALSGRCHSLHLELEAEALSILHTPPVQRWQGPVVGESCNVGPASSSTPASILKRRMVDLPPLASTPTPTDEEACPPTTPLIDDICPTPDPTLRRLRFAVSDTSLSETGPDLGTSARSMDASELDQSKERSGEMASFAQSATDGSSEHSSQFLTASDSEDDESGTELQEESPKSEHVGATELAGMVGEADDDHQAPEVTTKPAETSFTGLKDRLPAFLLQEAARCLKGLPTLDVPITGSPCKESRLRRGPRTPSPIEEEATDEDLDGTPLADDDKNDLGAKCCEQELQVPLDETGASEGALAVPEEEEEEPARSVLQTKSVIFLEAKMSTMAPPTRLYSHQGTTLMEEVSKPSSEESAMSLRVPVFVPCEGSGTGRKARLVEEVIAISASEASDSEKSEEEEDDEVVILSDNSSEIPRKPDGTDSREADWSRSPARSDADRKGRADTASSVGDDSNASSVHGEHDANEEENNVVVTELGSVQPPLPVEPLEVARESSLGLLTPAADVETMEVEQSLLDDDDSACVLQKESLPFTGSADLPPSDVPASATEMHLKGTADPINASFGFVLALDQSAIEVSESSIHEIATAVAEMGSLATVDMFTPKVVVVRLESSPPSAEPRSSVEGDVAIGEKPVSPPISPKCSPLKTGRLDSRGEGSPKERAVNPTEDSGEPSSSQGVVAEPRSSVEGDVAIGEKPVSPPISPKFSPLKTGRLDSRGEGSPKERAVNPTEDSGEPSSSQGVVETSYYLRERHKSTAKDKEVRSQSATSPTRGRRKSGSMSPLHPTPFTLAKAGVHSHGLEESAKRPASEARKARAASEEPMSVHSHKKRKVSPSPPGKAAKQGARGKSSTPSPGRKTLKSREKTQTPSPRRKAETPSPRRKAETPSPRLKAEMQSPGRKARTQSPGRKAQTQSPRPKALTPSPGRRAKTQSPKRTPGRPNRVSSVSRRLATPSPTKEATLSQKRAATKSVAKKQAATPNPKKQLLASPAKTPPRQSKASTATPSPEVEEPARSTNRRSAATSAGQKRSSVRSPPVQTARTPSPKKEVPRPSPVKDKMPSPAKKAVKKTNRGQRPTPADTAQQEPTARRTLSPTKNTGSKTARLAAPSSDVKQEPTATPAHRSTGATPKKRVTTPAKSTGARRRSTAAGTRSASLDTIAEVDDVLVEGDAEAGPSTRTRHHSSSEEPAQTTPAMKLSRSARRTRRVSSGTALGMIAEVPSVEAQEEAATPARRGRGSKRKASEEVEAASEGPEQSTVAVPPSSGKGPAPPRKKGKKPTEPTGADLPSSAAASGASPPMTRRRQSPKKGTTSATKSPFSRSSRDEGPKT